MWSKQSETLIDNSVAYVIKNQLNLFLWPDQLAAAYDQQIETEVSPAQAAVAIAEFSRERPPAKSLLPLAHQQLVHLELSELALNATSRS